MQPNFLTIRALIFFWVMPPLLWVFSAFCIAAFALLILPFDTDVMAFVWRRMPHIMLITQVLLLMWVMFMHKKQGYPVIKTGILDLTQRLRRKQAVYGFSLGILLSLIFILIVNPAVQYFQAQGWDYMPPGNVYEAMGTDGIILFLSTVVMAPLIEENVFRGLPLQSLMAKQNMLIAIIWSSIAFAAFHWTGGFWFMLMQGVIVGIPFAVIALRRGNIYMVLIAHFVMNISLFLFALSEY